MCQDEDDVPYHFDRVIQMLEKKIEEICFGAGGTRDPVLFLTGSENFRKQIAISKPYKGTRKSVKPYHFKNITVYMENQYDVVLKEGLEADDMMAVYQSHSELDTIICTRDKDLRMVYGWHYGWECGNCREFGPELVTPETEWLKLTRHGAKQTPKVTGTGLIFFYSQLITGDTVDNIPGLPRQGAVAAYELLTNPEDERPLWDRVVDLYEKKGFDEVYLKEQCDLLWMVQELTPEGEPVFWNPPS